ncbi:Na+/H+ antiporter subunit [Alicycliphilus sp. B1]|nr:Na+/H+ antiporter subunit [Alicycliphilus sp. B1]
MTPQALPLWLDIAVSVLCCSGAAIAFLGSLGLLRLKTYFERVHAPAIIATLGCWCIMHATLVYFSRWATGWRCMRCSSPCSWPSPCPSPTSS